MPQEAFTFERDYVRRLKLDYLRFLPPEYGSAPNQKWPLILFLHGAGERGSDLEAVKVHGIPKVAEEMGLPFVAISPQCPTNHWWSDYLVILDDLIAQSLATLDVDPTRVYLTGLSMGGFGSWHMAVEYPERFAAVAPVCGGGAWAFSVRERVCCMKDIPVWTFHGEKDTVVPMSEAQEMVDALQACGGDVRFTVFPDKQHDIFMETYTNPKLYEWFLSCQKSQTASIR